MKYIIILMLVIGGIGGVFRAGMLVQHGLQASEQVKKDKLMTKALINATKKNIEKQKEINNLRRISDAKYRELLGKQPILKAWHNTPVPDAAIAHAYGLPDGGS